MDAAQRGDLNVAEQGFKYIVKHAPMVVEGFLNLAVVYERGHKWSKAMQTYNEAQKVHPNSPKISNNMCVTLLRLLQEGLSSTVAEEATNVRSICRRALALDRDNPMVWSTLGDMHTLLVEWDPAAEAYNTALRLYHAVSESGALATASWRDSFHLQRTYSNLANSCSRAGKVPEAVVAASRALAIAPRDAHSLTLLATIRTTGHRFDFQSRAIKRRAALIQAQQFGLRDDSCPSGELLSVHLRNMSVYLSPL